MPSPELLLGEFPRTLDERFRLTLPPELGERLTGIDCILAKERIGCLSLWSADVWQEKLNAGVDLVQAKIRSGRLEGRLEDVQLLGRLLSTRHRTVQLAGRSRLVIPEGFREFLGVEPGGELMVVGAAVCIELWKPSVWFTHLESHLPDFRKLFDQLSS